MAGSGLLNSLVGKAIDDDVETFIETYSVSLARLVQRHKALRQGLLVRTTSAELATPGGKSLSSNFSGNFAATRM